MINVQLSDADAAFVTEQLTYRIDAMLFDLARSDDREFRRGLSKEIDQLSSIRDAIARTAGIAPPARSAAHP